MVGSHRIRTALAVLGASCLLAQALAVAPAAADDTELAPDRWVSPSCATGAITGFGVRVEGSGRTVLGLSGWIQPCRPDEPTNGFVVIAYRTTGGTTPGGLRPYLSTSAPTVFDAEVGLTGTTGVPAEQAVCVAFHPHGRLTCLGIDPRGPEQLPTLAPIGTDDPRVRVPVSVLGRTIADGPTCGTCV